VKLLLPMFGCLIYFVLFIQSDAVCGLHRAVPRSCVRLYIFIPALVMPALAPLLYGDLEIPFSLSKYIIPQKFF
jgi:hypothetical protein